MSDWKWTNDPDDPCSLDVQWDEGEDPNDWSVEARPYWPDGSTVPQVYRHIHDQCLASGIAYSEEAKKYG